MPVPQVTDRIKDAPGIVLRAVFAGVGQLLLAADRLRGRTEQALRAPERDDRQPERHVRNSQPKETGNVRLLRRPADSLRPETAPAEPETTAEPTAATEPETTTEPSAAAKPETPAKPKTAARPASAAKPGAPADSKAPAKPGAPADSKAPAKPASTAKPGAAADSKAPARSASAAKPKTPAKPKTAARPAAAAEAAEPAPVAMTDGQPAEAAPIPGYDELSVASLRARLRGLDVAGVARLVDYEKAHAGRAEVVTMYERRMAKLREQAP